LGAAGRSRKGDGPRMRLLPALGSIERATASSSFSYYREDQLPQKKLATGSAKRYEVFAKQLRFDIPTTDRTDIGIEFLYESMSGASPWFVSPNSVTGEPEQSNQI
jgi:hypothetical protein